MTLTLEHLPDALLAALTSKAASEGRSVQEVAQDALAKGLAIGATNGNTIKRDLSDVVGTWVEDPEFDAAMKTFERIDPGLWK